MDGKAYELVVRLLDPKQVLIKILQHGDFT
jgi:hypothetical protein